MKTTYVPITTNLNEGDTVIWDLETLPEEQEKYISGDPVTSITLSELISLSHSKEIVMKIDTEVFRIL